MLATQMSDVSEKLRYAFKMYDEDGSGTIDRGEMVDIVTNLYSMQGVAKVRKSLNIDKFVTLMIYTRWYTTNIN